MDWSELFDESAAARRRLGLVLYAIVGPIFIATLVEVRDPNGPKWTVIAVVVLILTGAASLWLRREPRR
jgi:hypothetical protein